MRDRYVHGAFLGLLVGGGLLIGCNDPAARTMTLEREQRVRYWLGEFATREREGSGRVNADLREIDRLWNEDMDKTQQNGLRVQHWVNEDLQRWDERKHAFPVVIQQEINGKPQNIRPTAILMFF
jgi:hypothetical protein